MKRNFDNLENEGKQHLHNRPQADLTIKEYADLVDEIEGMGPLDAAVRVLRIGVALGYRLAKNESKKECTK